MLRVILLLAVIVSLASCGSQSSGNQITTTVVKATIVGSNVKTFIRIPNTLINVYSVGDTVLLNVATHRIDESDTSSVRAIVKS